MLLFLFSFFALVFFASSSSPSPDFLPFPPNAAYDLVIPNGIADNFTIAAACKGSPHSKSRWWWGASTSSKAFRLDCLYPQPDNNGECPWFYSLHTNIWHYAEDKEINAAPTPPPPYCVENKIDDHSGNHPFGSQVSVSIIVVDVRLKLSKYPFEFPQNGTVFQNETNCPER